MAETEDAASRTEEATPHRLEEARKKGDVAKTPDLPQWASLAGAFGVLAIAGGYLMQRLAASLVPFLTHAGDLSVEQGGGVFVLKQAAYASAPILLTVMLAAGFAGAFGHVVQHGFLWNPGKLAPDLSKLNPMTGLQRMFGVDSLVQFLKTLLKVACTGFVAWMVIKPHAMELTNLAAMEPGAIVPAVASLLKALFFAILAFLGVTAAIDWLWQRYRFSVRMRMTREEVKEDFRQSEGDPHIKAKLKQMRLEKAKRRMMQNLPKATVVVMNPTHYAVALRYEPSETPAPQCVAKGLDDLALKIRAVAEQHGIPIVEDPPLARSLYAAVDIDDIIPPHHYEAVAKIIGFIMNGSRRAQGQRARPLR
ncbi:MAG TPA: flagellar biosynthesis protein FlhB [Caulobacteraceae bacterium]|nr:flagellar biosynthesis protein FlhB [Caulobacteraceae bacterium]